MALNKARLETKKLLGLIYNVEVIKSKSVTEDCDQKSLACRNRWVIFDYRRNVGENNMNMKLNFGQC